MKYLLVLIELPFIIIGFLYMVILTGFKAGGSVFEDLVRFIGMK